MRRPDEAPCLREDDDGRKCQLPKGHGGNHLDKLDGEFWEDLRPWSGKLEVHLTYACDLDCAGCNRASFLRKPHTDRVTMTHVHHAIAQAEEIMWKPETVVIIGGEPTMSPIFLDAIKAFRAWGPSVQVWSNAHSSKARSLLRDARCLGALICTDTQKPDGSQGAGLTERPNGLFWTQDIFLSPHDHGMGIRAPCFQHSAMICGVSMDAAGFSPCAMGGMIAALVAPSGRTERLADLFDKEKVAKMTRDLCKHCGHQMKIDATEVVHKFGTPMSATWVRAFEGKE